MTRTARLTLFLLAGAGLGVALVLAMLRLPAFGGSVHIFRDHAVAASVAHGTANVVSSINFDQRGLDTLGEESILLASVMGVTLLLRPADDESTRAPASNGRVLDATRLVGYLLLPVTIVIGLDLVAHGHLTPGGGFQGGVVLGTGLHLLYVAGRYQALERLRPLTPFEWGEAFAGGAFACLGIATVLIGAAFLANVIPYSGFGHLFSAGTVPLLNGVVGVEVASGVMVLLAQFLQQDLAVHRR